MNYHMSTERRETYHHGDLRRTLLAAAREEVEQHGAQFLSLSSLARRAGVVQSAPYRHFADRDELLAAVATEGFESFADALRQAAAGDEAGALRRMSAAYLRFGAANVELYRLMFASGLTPAAAEESPLQRAAIASFRPLLDGLAAQGRSRIDAYTAWAQLHGLVMLRADRFIRTPIEKLLGSLSL
jgi:AcrR family transcriptional regulator